MSANVRKRSADDYVGESRPTKLGPSSRKAARPESGDRRDRSGDSTGYNLPSSIGSSASNAIIVDDESDSDDGLVNELAWAFRATEDFELYGYVSTKIVGCRYYSGYVAVREMAMVRREPQNQYDSNAIQVLNVRLEQIGHIPRTLAAKLARFMDNESLLVEAFTTGEKGYFDCPVTLNLYGSKDPVISKDVKEEMRNIGLPKSAFAEVEKRVRVQERERKKHQKQLEKLRKGGTIVGEGNQSFESQDGEFAGSSILSMDGPSLEDIMKESETFNPRNVDEMVEKFGLKEEDLAAMPMADQPKGIATTLLPFQRQGLKWMLDRESPKLPQGSEESVQLWKRSDRNPGAYTHTATNFTIQGREPVFASGAILADDMGLGKTLQVISLIVADKEMKVPRKADASAATLVVAPLSVMSNWTSQIERHVKQNHSLKVLYYYGPKKPSLHPSNVDDWDVVVTNYDTIRVEQYGKSAQKARKSGISSINWRRIVLDEGHNIRNPAAKVSVAHFALKAQSRWVLTGTPIINSLKDLYSLVRFLGLSGGLDQFELFNGSIIRPLNLGVESAARILRDLMQSICLRRKKEMKFIDLKLPELSEYIHRIDFTANEREGYDALYAEAKGTLEEYRRQRGQAGTNPSVDYRNVLEMLLRLRQLCNHHKLVGEERLTALLGGDEHIVLDLTPENKAVLEKMLQLNIETQEDCPICIDTLKDPVITVCTHTFCFSCIERVIDTQQKCPMCRAPLESSSKLVRPPKEEEDEAPNKIEFGESSSKVDALLSIIKASASSPQNKTIVFSQWTRFLDLVEPHLVSNGVNFTRIDGRMNAAMRDVALEAFDKDPSVTVMLASLGVCSVGLNLVAANQVILADSWWAPAIEDQAVDRVHRLGQKRPTRVFRLVMRDSIEDLVLAIQERKRQLMMVAFAEKKGKRGNERGTHMADIQRLLN